MTPRARQVLTVLGLRLHDHPRAAEPERVEPRQQPVGEHLGHERGLVDARRGRVELDRLEQLLGRDGRDRFVLHLAAREPVGQRTGRAEAAEHRGGWELGERTERAQTQAGEEIDQVVPATVRRVDRTGEHGDRPRREEGGRLPRPARRPCRVHVLRSRARRDRPRTCRRRCRRARRRRRARARTRRCAPRARRRLRSSATDRASGTTTDPVVRARAAAPAARPRAPPARTRARRRCRRRRAPPAPRSAPRPRARAARPRPLRRAPPPTPRPPPCPCPGPAVGDDHDRGVDQRGIERRAATTGQSGHHSAQVRRGLLHLSRSSRPRELADAGTGRGTPALDLDPEPARLEDTRPRGRSSHAEPVACSVNRALPGHTAPRVSATTSTDSRSRARASSRRASPRLTPRGTSASTRLTPSSRAATTVAQRAGGTRRTTANRSSATPASAAASGPRVASTSTAAAHSPSAVTAAASSKPTVVAPAPGRPVTRSTEPRATVPPGTRSPSAPASGTARSRASTTGAAPRATSCSWARASSSRRGRLSWEGCRGEGRRSPSLDLIERMFDPSKG